MSQFCLPLRVYYEDTDASGVVYHATYLKFFERARTESLRSLGFTLGTLLQEHQTIFVVRALETEFLHSARLDQLLQVETTVEKVQHASIYYLQEIFDDATRKLVCRARVQIVCLDPNWHPKRVPAVIKRGIKEWELINL